MGLRYPLCFGFYSLWIHWALATLVLGSTIDLCALVYFFTRGLTHHIIPSIYPDLLVPLQLGLANVIKAAGAPTATLSP